MDGHVLGSEGSHGTSCSVSNMPYLPQWAVCRCQGSNEGWNRGDCQRLVYSVHNVFSLALIHLEQLDNLHGRECLY